MNRHTPCCVAYAAPRSLLVLILIGSITSSPLAADRFATWYLEDANERFSKGDLQGAIVQLKNSLQRDPGQLSAKLLLGKAQLAAGNPESAEIELEQALQLGADPLLVAVPLAKARNLLGKFEVNIESLRPTTFPDTVASDLWVELGIARLGRADVSGAEIAFQQALQIDSEHVGARLGFVEAFITRGQYEKAENQAALALSIAPERPDVWAVRAALYHAQGEHETAAAHYREALDRDANHYKAALGEAMALLGAGEAEASSLRLQAIREQWPLLLEAHYLHAKALTRLGSQDKAQKALEQAADLVSNATPQDLEDRPGQLLLASMVNFDTRQYEQSYGFLAAYLAQSPHDIAARKQMAVLLTRMGKHEEALKTLNRLKNGAGKDAQLQVLLGDVYTRIGRYMEAEAAYRMALGLGAASTEVVGRIGLAQFNSGRTDRAIATLNWLKENAPEMGSRASIFLAYLHFQKAEYAEAYSVADQVLDREPGNLLALNLKAAASIAVGDLALGREILAKVLEMDPTFRPSLANLVKLDILEKRYASADALLQRLLADAPNDSRFLETAAQLAVAQGDLLGGLANLERIRQSGQSSLSVYLGLAELYAQSGELAKAEAVAQEAAQQFPRAPAVPLLQGRLAVAAGDIEFARSQLSVAAGMAGTDTNLRVEIAGHQARIDALDDALDNLAVAIAQQPVAVRPSLLKAQLLARQKRLQEAHSVAQGLLTQHPDNPEVAVTTAQILMAMGEMEGAVALYRKGLESTDLVDFPLGLHRALLKAGQESDALVVLEDWQSRHGRHPAVMRRIADHYARIGASVSAQEIYQELLATEPDDVEVLNNLANVLAVVDIERALKTAMRAHQLAPNDAAVLDTLGWMSVQVGELEVGLGHLREAVSRNQRNPTIRYHLGVALHELGHFREARRELDAALAMGRSFPERQLATKRLVVLEAMGW